MSDRLQIPKMYKLFIGGKFTRTESERYIEAKNPKTKKKICNVSRASRKDLRNAVVEARNTFGVWNSKTHYERGQILYRFAEMLEGKKEQFIEEIFISTKQTKRQCRKEVTKAIDRMVFYAGFCDKWTQLTGTVNPVQKGLFPLNAPATTPVFLVKVSLRMPGIMVLLGSGSPLSRRPAAFLVERSRKRAISTMRKNRRMLLLFFILP